MSVHSSVTCDKCGDQGFSGKRYKCLICYDFDLCASCHDSLGDQTFNNGRHNAQHPVQCILTRSDMALYYGGENSAEYAYSFTCPYCTKSGFSEILLQDHVNTQHADQTIEVICPICACIPNGDPNHVSDDFSEHLALEHQAVREMDDANSRRLGERRMPHSRGVRVKGHNHRLTPSQAHLPPSANNLNNTTSNSYNMWSNTTSNSYARRERTTLMNPNQFTGSSNDPLNELLSQLSLSNAETFNISAPSLASLEAMSDERMQRIARHCAEYSKCNLGGALDKISATEDKTTHIYKSLLDARNTVLAKESGSISSFNQAKKKDMKELIMFSLSPQQTTAKEVASQPEENKIAYDLKKSEQFTFVQELLVSCISEATIMSSSSDDEF